MKTEQIEKAAKRYADGIAQFDERKTYSREDFTAGAQWRINSVWHVDEPKIGGELCLLERGGGVYVLAYSYTSEGKFVCFDGLWGTGDMFMDDIIRYAYIKDLTPIKQENLDY